MAYRSFPRDLSLVLRPESIMHNPFPAFRSLREQSPFYWDEAMQGGFATGYTFCKAIIHSPQFFTRADLPGVLGMSEQSALSSRRALHILNQSLFFQDGSAHRKLRNLLSPLFAQSNIERWRPHMEFLATHLLERCLERTRIDILREFAYPFAGTVFTALFGIPQCDQSRVSQWACDIELLLAERASPPQETGRWLWGLAQLIEYMKRHSSQAHTRFQEDVFRPLVDAYQQEKQLSEAEFLGNIAFLFSASVAETAQLIGSTFFLLLNHPEYYRLVRENPLMIKAAVEEMLRYDGPVVHLLRFAREDCEISGRQIRAGQHVTLCVSAANRDPVQFSRPDIFDIHRGKRQHLAFGYGSHSCLGAHLARTMTEIALSRLLGLLHRPRVVAREPEPLKAMRYLKTLIITHD